MATTQQSVDPVLVRLSRWATKRGMGREAVASEIGTSRSTVAGWFLGLAAFEKAEPPSSSARVFRFTKQPPEVQERIAELLEIAVDELRAESLGVAAGTPPPVTSEMGEVVHSLLGDLAGGFFGRSSTLGAASERHRIAETAERVHGVAATSVIGIPRGRATSVPYLYQIVLSARPGPDGPQEESYLGGIRARVNEALAAASIYSQWEHGRQAPEVDIGVGGHKLTLLGSLICPALEASRAPRSALLVEPRPGAADPDQFRVATVLSSPYGGSDPIAGMVAHRLSAGHLRADELVRAALYIQAQQTGRSLDERGATFGEVARRDSGFILHLACHLLEAGRTPGAWLASMESLQLGYGPLRTALEEQSGVLIATHLGARWIKLAAWRLAAATLNEAGRQLDRDRQPGTAGSTDPSLPGRRSSDSIEVVEGRPVSDSEAAVLRHQAGLADELARDLEAAEQLLGGVVAARRRHGLPTVTTTLEEVPDTLGAHSFDTGTYTRVVGDARFSGAVILDDNVDAMVDSWADAAVRLLDELARLTGHEDATAVAGGPGPDHIGLALAARGEASA